jgi:hypothetical protein
MGEGGGEVPCILKLGSRWHGQLRALLYPREMSTWYPVDKMVVGPYSLHVLVKENVTGPAANLILSL